MHEPIITRRAAAAVFGLTGLGLLTGLRQPTAPAKRDDSAARKLGWTLGVQAWTFRDRTCLEAARTAVDLGLTAIELYPGQPYSPEHPDLKIGPEMKPDQRKGLADALAKIGIKPLNFGVTGFTKDQAKAREMVQFAKEIGVATITTEPDPDGWPVAAAIAAELGITLACHNHPKPSRYWDPQVVLTSIKDLPAERVGGCADVGHWLRSGLNPVECLKRYEGRLKTLHLKDTDAAKADKPDVPFGTGGCDMRAMLAELKRQGFRGVLSIEYETGKGPTLEREVRESIAFFDRCCAAL